MPLCLIINLRFVCDSSRVKKISSVKIENIIELAKIFGGFVFLFLRTVDEA